MMIKHITVCIFGFLCFIPPLEYIINNKFLYKYIVVYPISATFKNQDAKNFSEFLTQKLI